MSYVTKEYLETQFQNFATRLAIVMAKKSEIPLKVSDLTNDLGFITSAVDNLVNYYTKSQTYTKEEIAALVSTISTVTFEVVDTLPTDNISTNTIYLVPKGNSLSGNSYTEYANINGNWEIIGDTDVNLTGYVTTEQLAAKLNDYLQKTDVETENIDFSTYFVE